LPDNCLGAIKFGKRASMHEVGNLVSIGVF